MSDDRGLKVERLPPPTTGRDQGKVFVVHEWPAIRAEKWGWRMVCALKGTAGYIPLDIEENIAQHGMVGVAIRGLNAFLQAPVRFEDIEPLLDEMLTCVRMVRDPARPDIETELVPEMDITDVKTLGWLRGEVLRVHTGFSLAEALLRLTSAIKEPAPAS